MDENTAEKIEKEKIENRYKRELAGLKNDKSSTFLKTISAMIAGAILAPLVVMASLTIYFILHSFITWDITYGILFEFSGVLFRSSLVAGAGVGLALSLISL